MKGPGGYQMIDISGVNVNTQAVTITDAKNAEILRNTRKPVYFYGAKVGGVSVSGPASAVSDTGAVDGKVYTVSGPQGKFKVSTDDDEITVTPVAD